MWLPDFNLIRIDLDIEGLVQAMLLEDFTMAGSRVSIGNDPQRDVLLLAFGHEFSDTGSKLMPGNQKVLLFDQFCSVCGQELTGPDGQIWDDNDGDNLAMT